MSPTDETVDVSESRCRAVGDDGQVERATPPATGEDEQVTIDPRNVASRLDRHTRVLGKPDERGVEVRAVHAERLDPRAGSGVWEIEDQASAMCSRDESLDRLGVSGYLLEET